MALRCEATGKEVNLTPQDKPADIYQTVITKVKDKLESRIPHWDCMTQADAEREATELLRHSFVQKEAKAFLLFMEEVLSPFYDEKGNKIPKSEEALKGHKIREEYLAMYSWLKFGLNRKISKRSVMTFPYGSRAYGFRDQLMEDIVDKTRREQTLLLESGKITREEYDEAYPFVHLSGYAGAGHMANWLYEAVTGTVVKAAEAMQWLKECAKLVAKGNKPVIWTTPLGFPVKQHYHKSEKQLIKTSFLGAKDVRFIMRKSLPDVDGRKQSASVSPNFVHSLDASHLMLVTARSGLDNLALVHDSFGTLPSRTDYLFKVLREEFFNLYTEVDVFENFREEVLQQLDEKEKKKLAPCPEKGSLDLSLINQSMYCFA
jgi:DNA-directed RNA polymerase